MVRVKTYMCTLIKTTTTTSNLSQVFWAVPIIVSSAMWDTRIGKIMYAHIFVKGATVLENVHQNQNKMIVATAIDVLMLIVSRNTGLSKINKRNPFVNQ